jgi:phosphatidylserine/phosphatidylglycerophosphate/cardiolipin synthase-like enzyme
MILSKYLARCILAVVLIVSGCVPVIQTAKAESSSHLVINEIAWMGTTTDYNNEWIEIYNPTSSDVNLNGWTLASVDGTPSISLTGTISANGFYILERTSDSTLPEITANQIYTGALGNSGEDVTLKDPSGTVIDEVNQWYAGDNSTKATMERVSASVSGTDASNWITATETYGEGYGTPGSLTTGETSSGGTINNGTGAINVYFNKSSDHTLASTGNVSNDNINLENRLVNRINNASKSIDAAVYEINLPGVVSALMNRAAAGIPVRVMVDAKNPTDQSYIERYELMRVNLEKLIRGNDGTVGTADDVHVYADSAIFAVEDPTYRQQYGLPADGYQDFAYKTVTIGSTPTTGYFMVDGETKATDEYYSADNQMHNKFCIIDGTWVWTGSWNWTTTGLYGTDANRDAGILGGNSNNSVEINSTDLASIYRTEFDEMWGSDTTVPNPSVSNFGDRKTDNTPHTAYVNGKEVDVYFSGGDNALGHVVDYINQNANYNDYFCIFAWSDQSLVDALKQKWEGSTQDEVGTLTGFKVKGVFDSGFWNDWWSASIDMTGRTASQTSTGNPNTRWANPAPVYSSNEDRKLHDKYMMVDVDTNSDPTVITGSTNWSSNGNDYNDENLLMIHDAQIANQYEQDFAGRYETAGGQMN